MTSIKSLVFVVFILFTHILTAQNFNWAFAIDSDGDDEVCQLVYKNEVIHSIGYLGGGADFDPSGLTSILDVSQSKDAFLARYSDNKKLLFATKLTSGKGQYVKNGQSKSFSNGGAFPFDFCIDSENNYYVVGGFEETVNFNPNGEAVICTSPEEDHEPRQDIFMAKYAPDGKLIWLRTIGGDSDDIAEQIEMGPDGTIYIQGTYSDRVDFNPNEGGDIKTGGYTNWGNNTFVTHLAADGTYLWTKTYHSYKSDGVTTGRMFTNDFKVDPNTGDYYIAGHFAYTLFLEGNNKSNATLINERNGKYSGFIAKYNSEGELLWASEAVAGENESLCYIQGITIANDSKIYITGHMRGTGVFTNGTKLTVDNISWGGFVACLEGSTDKTLWAKVFNKGSEFAKIYPGKISISHENEIFIIGRYLDTMTLNIDGDVDITSTPASDGTTRKYDYFIFNLDYEGTLENYYTIGGPGNEGYKAPAVLGDNKELYLMGVFEGNANFNIQNPENSYYIESVGNEAAFITRFDNMMAKSSGKNILSFELGYIDETIPEIEAPLGSTYSTIEQNITISQDASFSFYNADNNEIEVTSTSDISEGSSIVVTAQNGEQKTYYITLTEGNDILATEIGTLIQTTRIIERIPAGTSVADFITGLTISGGASCIIINNNEEVSGTSEINTGMIAKVTSVTGVEKEYSLAILLEGNEIIATQLGTIDTTNQLLLLPTNIMATDLVAGLTISEGATIKLFKNESTLSDLASVIVNEEITIHITSQSGNVRLYSLQIVANAQNYILSTNIGILISITRNIMNIPSSTTISEFRAALTVSEGATITFYDTESEEIINNESMKMKSDIEIWVTSLTGDKAIYTIDFDTSEQSFNEASEYMYYLPKYGELIIVSNKDTHTIEIYDISGKLVHRQEALDNAIKLDLKPGIYIGIVRKEYLSTRFLIQ